MNSVANVRVWDLPTRIFHWVLVGALICLVTTGYVGGNAMVWHFRFGFTVINLLMFRLVWGLVGGRWSRFQSFLFSPRTILAYLKGDGHPAHSVGHNPLGAGSVFAMLAILIAQVSSGMVSDDEIAFSGPMSKFVSNATVSLATNYHKNIGKWLLLALVVLHLGAIAFYYVKKHENLVRPMIKGDKSLPGEIPPSRDDTASRSLAAVVFVICAVATAWVVHLGD